MSGEEEIDEEALALLLFTSGSSGEEKIGMLTFANLHYNARGFLHHFPLKSRESWHLSLPLFHVGGLGILMRCFVGGAAVAFSEKTATYLSLVPTQLYRRLHAPHAPKAVLLGGGPASLSLFEEAQAKGISLFTAYSMTEMGSTITLDTSPSIEEGHITAGICLPHREFKIAADGEIWVRGKTLFLGYLDQMPQKKEWFPTKDLGKISPSGKLIVLGRKDNLFISGGENIFPEEIEQALLNLPVVTAAVVVPVPCPEFGERPVAFVESETPEKALQNALREILPGYKVPLRIFPLPKETGLKPSRPFLKALAKEYVNGRG